MLLSYVELHDTLQYRTFNSIDLSMDARRGRGGGVDSCLTGKNNYILLEPFCYFFS